MFEVLMYQLKLGQTAVVRNFALFFRQSMDLFVFFFLLCLPIPPVAASGPEEQKNILILHSYNWGFQWTDGQMEGLTQKFRESGENLAITVDQLDVIARPDFDSQTYAEYLKWRLGKTKFALVVVTDSPALSFVAEHYETMFKGLPVVFSDISDLDDFDLPADMPLTGVVEHTEFQSTIDLARDLRPNAKQILVFGNAAENGSGPRVAQSFMSDLALDIPITFLLDKPYEEILEIASEIDPQDIVFNLSYALDSAKRVHSYVELAIDISAVSPAPLFDFWSITVQSGAMSGGKTSDPFLQGYTAAGLALRVLDGKNPREMQNLVAPTKYLFHYPQLVRHSIGLDMLPEGSEVLERPPSVYEDYRDVIWGAVALLAFLTIVIIILLHSIRVRRQGEIALAAAHDRLEELVDQRTTELVESEKMAALGGLVSGVAHEINTPVGISMTAASSLQEYTDELVENYRKSNLNQTQLENFIETAKRTSGILMSNLERAAGLVQSFKQVAVDQSTDTARQIDLKSYLNSTVSSLAPELKPGKHTIEVDCPDDLVIETHPGIIAQILTNFVLNSVRHGFGDDVSSGQIRIGVAKVPDGIELTYADNGKGMSEDVLKRAFEPFFTTARGKGGTGLGLSIVYNLVTHKLGGKIKSDSSPGQGVLFTLQIPDQCSGELKMQA
jgi:signal transduction histidine kinase